MRGIYNDENILENINEGYSKGNAFKNLYVPYKNYKVKKLVPRNEQEDLFFKLSAAAFYAHEINLLLDIVISFHKQTLNTSLLIPRKTILFPIPWITI